MSSRKRKGSKTILSLYKTKYFKNLKSQTFLESLNSSQNSTLSDNFPEDKTFHVLSCQTEIQTSIKSMQIQTDNPKLKNSHCQTNSGKITDC